MGKSPKIRKSSQASGIFAEGKAKKKGKGAGGQQQGLGTSKLRSFVEGVVFGEGESSGVVPGAAEEFLALPIASQLAAFQVGSEA